MQQRAISITIRLLVCAIGVCACVNAIAQEDPSLESPNPSQEQSTALPEHVTADGILKDAGEKLQLLTLVADGEYLKARILPMTDARQSVQQLQRDLRSGGGSRISGDAWEISMNSLALRGRFRFGEINGRVGRRPVGIEDIKPEFPMLRVDFAELAELRRSLRIVANEDRFFQLTLTGGKDDYFIRFKQNNDGRIICWDISEAGLMTFAAVNFDEFCRQNREYCEQRLLPVFKFTGVGTPATPYSRAVRTEVLNLLTPADPDEMEKFKQLVANLDDSSFKVREEATAIVESDFEKWRNRIQQALSDPQFPPETRLRLRRVYDANVTEGEKQASKGGRAKKLAADVSYLVWLLEESTRASSDQQNEDALRAVGKRLNELTGEDLGADAGAWRQWLATDDAASSRRKPDDVEEPATAATIADATANQTPLSFDDLLTSLGPRDVVAENIGSLIRLKVRDGDLTLDRNHWKEPFDGLTAKVVIGKMKEAIRENNLPEDWFHPGGAYSIDTTGFPQMLFEKMAARVRKMDNKPSPQYSPAYRQVTWDRAFEVGALTGSLVMQDEPMVRQVVRGAVNREVETPEQTRFDFTILETGSPGRTFNFKQALNGGPLVIEFIYDESDAMIRLVQLPRSSGSEDRCSIVEVIGGESTTVSGRDFSELVETHGEYVEEKLVSLLKTLKIEIAD